ncbi:MAG TPA: Hsp20/alpha crystallin family protein [Chitinophagaceae bacterium]|jgi:HSP20 family protein|nr:Hsp20/alpha crystallin family protein [Chitinophagaceae bacterium]
MTVVKFNNKPNNGFSLLDNFFSEFPTVFKENFSIDPKGSVPVNVKEIKDAYLLDVVAPGFEKTDFNVNVEKNILTISVEKKNEVKDESEKQIRREYSYHSFKRSFTLDEKIDSEKIEAKYVNGVLTLNLPRKAEVKASTKEISIQ